MKNKKAVFLDDLRIYIAINCACLIISLIGIYFEGYCGIFGGLIFCYVFFGACAVNVILDIVIIIYSVYDMAKNSIKNTFVFTLTFSSLSIILNIYCNWIAYNLIFCPA